MEHDAYRDLAIARAAAHARRYLILGSTFRRCMSAAAVEPQTYSRALHQVERRTLTIQHAPARGAAVGRNDEPPSASADPWSFDPATIEQVSRRACLCPSCRGDGTVPCATCRGDAAVRCRACSGSGRVMGSRNRMKNCPTCRARGQVACTACSAGRVACRTCERTGRVEAWLTMQRAQLSLVSASGSRAGMAVLGLRRGTQLAERPHAGPRRRRGAAACRAGARHRQAHRPRARDARADLRFAGCARGGLDAFRQKSP